MPAGTYTNLALAEQLLDALDKLSGLHPGFRPAHAKGLMSGHESEAQARGSLSPRWRFGLVSGRRRGSGK
jgi:hypothetical protein